MMITAKKIIAKTSMYIIMLFTITVSIFPILWIIMSSFKTNGQILNNPFTLPTSISFDAYVYLFKQYNFFGYTVNSILTAGIGSLSALLFYSMAAYAISKFNFPGKRLCYVLFSMTLLIPAQAKAQPIFDLIINLGLYDTLWGLAAVYISSGMAISLFILTATFLAIPKSLDEAAELDGAGFFKRFWKINIPLAKNGLSTAGILMFLDSWNEFFYASLLTSSEKSRTLPIALQFFNEAFSYDYTKLFAALTVVVLPGIILYICAQEQVQASIISSGVKG